MYMCDCVCRGRCPGITMLNEGPCPCTQDVPSLLPTPQEVQLKVSLDHSPSLGASSFGAFCEGVEFSVPTTNETGLKREPQAESGRVWARNASDFIRKRNVSKALGRATIKQRLDKIVLRTSAFHLVSSL